MGRDMPTSTFPAANGCHIQGQEEEEGVPAGVSRNEGAREEQEGRARFSYSNPMASLGLFLCPCSAWKGWWPVRPIALVLHLSVTIPCYFLLLIPCILASIVRVLLQCEAYPPQHPVSPPLKMHAHASCSNGSTLMGEVSFAHVAM